MDNAVIRRRRIGGLNPATLGAGTIVKDFTLLSSLRKETTGQLPVDVAPDPIGLVLDSVDPAMLLPEKLTNAGFDSNVTGWSGYNNTISWQAGAMRVTRTGAAAAGYQAFSVEAGKTYVFESAATRVSGTGTAILAIRPDAAAGTAVAASASIGAAGTMRCVYRAATTTTLYFHCAIGGAAAVYDFAYATCRETVGPATMFVDGNRPLYGRAPLSRRNILLGTATLATQNKTVFAEPQTLSFKGTGTVTLSGVSTDGPLVGTGAADRVELTFTPASAGTLTLTVTGSVTDAQLEYSNAATAYQAVSADGMDITEAGVVSYGYAMFDLATDQGTTYFPTAQTGDTMYFGHNGMWIEPAEVIGAGGTQTIGPDGTVTRTGILNDLQTQFGIAGSPIVGWVSVPRSLTDGERSQLIRWGRQRGAGGMVLADQTQLPDSTPARVPSGFTCTGLDRVTRGAYAGMWLIGDDGRLVEADASPYAPAVHVVSADFTTIVATFPMNYSGASVQGVAVDTSGAADTFWVATSTNGDIRHFDLTGAEIAGDRFVWPYTGNPNGLAYDPVNDALWIVPALQDTVRLISCDPSASPRLLNTITIARDTPDHLHYKNGLLYYSYGGLGSGFVRRQDVVTGESSLYCNAIGAQASEGIYHDADARKFFCVSDGGYHNSAMPPANIALTYIEAPA